MKVHELVHRNVGGAQRSVNFGMRRRLWPLAMGGSIVLGMSCVGCMDLSKYRLEDADGGQSPGTEPAVGQEYGGAGAGDARRGSFANIGGAGGMTVVNGTGVQPRGGAEPSRGGSNFGGSGKLGADAGVDRNLTPGTGRGGAPNDAGALTPTLGAGGMAGALAPVPRGEGERGGSVPPAAGGGPGAGGAVNGTGGVSANGGSTPPVTTGGAGKSGTAAAGSGGSAAAGSGGSAGAGGTTVPASSSRLLYSFDSDTDTEHWRKVDGDPSLPLNVGWKSCSGNGCLGLTVPADAFGGKDYPDESHFESVVGEFDSNPAPAGGTLVCKIFIPSDCEIAAKSFGIFEDGAGDYTLAWCDEKDTGVWQTCSKVLKSNATKIGVNFGYAPYQTCLNLTILVDACWVCDASVASCSTAR